MEKRTVRRNDLLYPELSYRVVGILFDVYNELGSGHREEYYQRTIAKALRNTSLLFQEQVSFPLKYRGATVGKYRIDFLIEDKILLEIKRGPRFSKRHIDQVLEYLKTTHLRLAILSNFGPEGVLFKRIISA